MIDLYLEYLKKNPPKVSLKGWWWKKYFKSYRHKQEIMQYLLDWGWKNGGAKEFRDEMIKKWNQAIDNQCLEVFNNGFSTNYTNEERIVKYDKKP